MFPVPSGRGLGESSGGGGGTHKTRTLAKLIPNGSKEC